MSNEKRELLAAALRQRIQASSGSLPLSHGQRALWFLHQLAPDSSAYNIAFTSRVISPVDAVALRRAFQALVDRHDSLRSTFPAEHGEPVRRTERVREIAFDHVDVSGWSDDRVNDELLREISRPFDLANGPMLRVRLLTRSRTDAYLAATFHHIALDGWSLWLCLSELGELYRAAVLEVPPNLEREAAEYAVYLRAQAEMLSGPEGARHKAYWKAQLGSDVPILSLATDKARPAVSSYRGASHRFRIGARVTERLLQVTRERRATLQMGVLALFQILLHRYTGQDDLTVGYLASGRSRPQLESVVGYLANPLTLRATMRPQMSYREVLQQTRDTLLDALEHQDYPFSLVVDECCPDRNVGRSPLFQVLFVFEKPQLLEDEHASSFIVGEPGARMTLGELVLESLPISAQREGQFDLTLVVTESDGELALSIDYSTDLFEPATIERMAGHLITLASSAVADLDAPVSVLPMLTQQEVARIQERNGTCTPVPPVCFHQLIEAHAVKCPDAVAVVFEDQELTYGELNGRADAVAEYLRDLGVRPDTAVGLCVERSPALVVAALGILKAGGAFVPLDPAYPRDRLAFMIGDSQVPVLITQQSLLERLPSYSGRLLRIEDLATRAIEQDVRADAPTAAPHNLAYVIYTSGSTGRPKGVLLEHRGLVNVAMEQQRLFGVGPHSRVLQFASLSFDAAVFEMAMALGSGAALHLAPPASLLPGAPLLSTLRARGINVVTLPPSALLNVPIEDLPALTTITVAGEACPAELVARWAPGRAFFNLYGPTEATIWATAVRCVDASRTPSIGRPIANTQVYVLDRHLQLVPAGVPGELHIGGAGLARGYHNRPDLTAARFIPNPFSSEPGARLYRTGDLVRVLENGEIEFLGRIDHQVKIRGFRIELGEIEAVLGEHPDVNQVIAVVREDGPGGQRIVAYVVPRPSAAPSVGALKGFLKGRLPDFMVPAAIVVMDRFPVTPAGKIDRHALPPPETLRAQAETFVAPAGDLEEPIAAIWKQILRVDRVGADDNFFELGGTSLLIARVHARVNEIVPSAVSIVDMFQYPTVRALAARLAQGSADRCDESAAARAGALMAGQERLRHQARRRSRSDGDSTLE